MKNRPFNGQMFMPTTSNPDDDGSGPRTLRRGLRVLTALRDAGAGGLSITQISRLTQLQRPTVYRLIAALCEAGMATALPAVKKYCANFGVSQDAQLTHPLIAITLASLKRLAMKTGDAVFLVVRDGDDSLSLHREIGGYPVQILATYAGKRQPLGVGSASLAILADLPDEEMLGIIERNSNRFDEFGAMTRQEMIRLVENSRSRGYAVIGNHAVRGAIGVGCTLKGNDGQPIFAISVTAIIERMSATRQREIAGWIQDEIDQIKANELAISKLTNKNGTA